MANDKIYKGQIQNVKNLSKNESNPSAVPSIEIRSRQIYMPTRIDPEKRSELQKKYGSEPLKLIFENNSCEKIKEFIGWGQHTPKNRVEQGGILLGKVYRYKNEIFSIVEDCILADTRGQACFVEFTHEMWARMQQQADEINKSRKEEDKLVIVGWFHTHPNNLAVFMSSTDRDTQNKNFSQDWQAALVLNPHRKNLSVFFGKEVIEGFIVRWNNNHFRPNPTHKDPPPRVTEYERGPTGDDMVGEYKKVYSKYIKQIEKLERKNRISLLITLLACVLLIAQAFGFVLYETLFSGVGHILTPSILLASVLVITQSVGFVLYEVLFSGRRQNSTRSRKQSECLDSEGGSTVFFNITCDQCKDLGPHLSCTVKIQEVKKASKDDALLTLTKEISCNSNSKDAFVNLRKGTYKVSFTTLPILPNGKFEPLDPIEITVDGKTPCCCRYSLN